jgi:hypothetical protein
MLISERARANLPVGPVTLFQAIDVEDHGDIMAASNTALLPVVRALP